MSTEIIDHTPLIEWLKMMGRNAGKVIKDERDLKGGVLLIRIMEAIEAWSDYESSKDMLTESGLSEWVEN